MFVSGEYDIEYLEARGETLLEVEPDSDTIERIAVATALSEHRHRASSLAMPDSSGGDARASAWVHAARRESLR